MTSYSQTQRDVVLRSGKSRVFQGLVGYFLGFSADRPDLERFFKRHGGKVVYLLLLNSDVTHVFVSDHTWKGLRGASSDATLEYAIETNENRGEDRLNLLGADWLFESISRKSQASVADYDFELRVSRNLSPYVGATPPSPVQASRPQPITNANALASGSGSRAPADGKKSQKNEGGKSNANQSSKSSKSQRKGKARVLESDDDLETNAQRATSVTRKGKAKAIELSDMEDAMDIDGSHEAHSVGKKVGSVGGKGKTSAEIEKKQRLQPQLAFKSAPQGSLKGQSRPEVLVITSSSDGDLEFVAQKSTRPPKSSGSALPKNTSRALENGLSSAGGTSHVVDTLQPRSAKSTRSPERRAPLATKTNTPGKGSVRRSRAIDDDSDGDLPLNVPRQKMRRIAPPSSDEEDD